MSFRHGIEHHELARAALLQTGARSDLLMLAQAIGRPAPIRCAVVNSLGLPVGVDLHAPAEGGVTLEPVRERDAIPAFDGAGDAIERAYDARSASLADAPSSFAAAERLVRANCSVVFVQPFFSGRPDRQIDTHEDVGGKEARARIATITPALNTFVARLLALPDRNVVITLVGEFCRTVAAHSDHEPGGTATVIGKHVRVGTSGPQTADGAPHPSSAPTAGLWSVRGRRAAGRGQSTSAPIRTRSCCAEPRARPHSTTNDMAVRGRWWLWALVAWLTTRRTAHRTGDVGIDR